MKTATKTTFLVELLCHLNHCIIAAPFEAAANDSREFKNKKIEVISFLEVKRDELCIADRCGICGSTELRYSTRQVTQDTVLNLYLPPNGTPLFWMNEQSGKLARAVRRFLDSRLGDAEKPDEDDLKLLVNYLSYYIHAPCWRGEGLPTLRERVNKLSTENEISEWIRDALQAGFDPL